MASAALGLARRVRLDTAYVRVAGALVIVLLWEGVAHSSMFPKAIFPSILDVARSLLSFVTSAGFYRHLGVTAFEVLVAFAIGSGAGLIVGLFGGMSSYFGKVVDPYLHYLAPTPKIIFLPLLMLMLGVGIGSKIGLGVVSAFFPVAVATLAGMRHLPDVLVRVGASFRLTTWQMVRKIYIPALAAPITTGLGLGLGAAMTGVLLGECKMSNQGLGFLTIEAYRGFRIADMYALLALSFTLAVVLTTGIERIGRRFNRRSAY